MGSERDSPCSHRYDHFVRRCGALQSARTLLNVHQDTLTSPFVVSTRFVAHLSLLVRSNLFSEGFTCHDFSSFSSRPRLQNVFKSVCADAHHESPIHRLFQTFHMAFHMASASSLFLYPHCHSEGGIATLSSFFGFCNLHERSIRRRGLAVYRLVSEISLLSIVS